MNEENEKCACGEEATKGCHAVVDNVIIDQYVCDACFNKGISWAS